MFLLSYTVSVLCLFPLGAACGDPEMGGVQTSLKNHKNIGFLSNIGPDPLKITKLLGQHSMLGHGQHAGETPFKWRLAGGPIMARL